MKLVETEDGGLEVLAFDWKTGEFIGNMNYLTRCTFPDVEVDVVTKEEFDRDVALLRRWKLRYYCRLISNAFRRFRTRAMPDC